MRCSRTRLAVAASVLLLTAGCSDLLHPHRHIAPPQDTELAPSVLHKFQHEIEEYVDLHQALLKRVPTVTEKSTAEEMAAHRRKMTTAIRAERRKARQGEIFKPKVAEALREVLLKELSGPRRDAVLDEIRSGNPRFEGTPRADDPSRETMRNFRVAVNAVYPEDAPMSNVPSSLLLHLPPLPGQVKYGFVGRDLILVDTEAGVILDFIGNVVPDEATKR